MSTRALHPKTTDEYWKELKKITVLKSCLIESSGSHLLQSVSKLESSSFNQSDQILKERANSSVGVCHLNILN